MAALAHSEAAVQLEEDVDVCIIGSGPDALSVLSALHEPFAQLKPADYNRALSNSRRSSGGGRLKHKMKVCVVSPSMPA